MSVSPGIRLNAARAQGAQASPRCATVTGTTYNNTGLAASTSYSYRVRATDAAGNLSGYSNTASATPSDTTPPSAPSNLTAAAISTTQINLCGPPPRTMLVSPGIRLNAARAQGAQASPRCRPLRELPITIQALQPLPVTAIVSGQPMPPAISVATPIRRVRHLPTPPLPLLLQT